MLFFFSSRRRHTRYIGDWSSDVCSSDLYNGRLRQSAGSIVVNNNGVRSSPCTAEIAATQRAWAFATSTPRNRVASSGRRSEERRVGKESKSRWAGDHYKKEGKSWVNDVV